MNEPALNREIVGGYNPDGYAVFTYGVGVVGDYPVVAYRHGRSVLISSIYGVF